MDSTLLGQEWQTLQNNHEQHEKNALLIKLASLTLCIGGLAFSLPLLWIAFAVLLCWGLEGIFKTYQARLSERLLLVEAMLNKPQPTGAPMQLHTEWSAGRPGGGALIAAYARSACRPTVAFPYLPILLMLGIDYWLFWI